jgi:hypothetical protein
MGSRKKKDLPINRSLSALQVSKVRIRDLSDFFKKGYLSFTPLLKSELGASASGGAKF